MKYLKIVLFPSPFSRWSHSIVLKSLPLIIGIVYRILKITSEQLFPFNESELSHSANCRYNLRLFRLFRGDSSGMDKSSSAKCLLYSDVVKGEPNPTGRARRSRDEKGNQGVGDIRSQIFYNFFLFISFFQLLYFITFFLNFFLTHDIYPHPRPTTHDI